MNDWFASQGWRLALREILICTAIGFAAAIWLAGMWVVFCWLIERI